MLGCYLVSEYVCQLNTCEILSVINRRPVKKPPESWVILWAFNQNTESQEAWMQKGSVIFNLGCLEAQTEVALRRLQCNNGFLHIHLTDILFCWQPLPPEPRSLFRFPQLRPEGSLHLAPLCSSALFLSSSKDSRVRLSNGKYERERGESNREFHCQI